MTMFNQAPRIDVRSHFDFRLGTLLFAGLLGLQCVWLLAAELVRPRVDRLPTDITAARVASEKRGAAHLAASIGILRGDLWATPPLLTRIFYGANREQTKSKIKVHYRAPVQALIVRSMNSPHLSSAWLPLGVSPPVFRR